MAAASASTSPRRHRLERRLAPAGGDVLDDRGGPAHRRRGRARPEVVADRSPHPPRGAGGCGRRPRRGSTSRPAASTTSSPGLAARSGLDGARSARTGRCAGRRRRAPAASTTVPPRISTSGFSVEALGCRPCRPRHPIRLMSTMSTRRMWVTRRPRPSARSSPGRLFGQASRELAAQVVADGFRARHHPGHRPGRAHRGRRAGLRAWPSRTASPSASSTTPASTSASTCRWCCRPCPTWSRSATSTCSSPTMWPTPATPCRWSSGSSTPTCARPARRCSTPSPARSSSRPTRGAAPTRGSPSRGRPMSRSGQSRAGPGLSWDRRGSAVLVVAEFTIEPFVEGTPGPHVAGRARRGAGRRVRARDRSLRQHGDR